MRNWYPSALTQSIREYTTSLMHNRLVGLLTAMVLLGGLTACDQVDLDEAQPTTSISLEQTVSSQAGFEGLITSMYDRLQNFNLYGQQYMLVPDALADNVQLRPGATSNRYPGFVTNQRFSHLGGYGLYFSNINEANNVIEDIGDLSLQVQNPQDVRDRIRAEALFHRGLAYFDLGRIYGYLPGREVDGFDLGVPLRTEPTRSTDDADNRERDPNPQVLAQAASDMRTAANLLEGNPNAQGAPQRATAAAAFGMLSRIELYRENWQKADSAATAALGLTGASVVDARSEDFEAAWTASSYPGSIFELSMTAGTDGDATNANQALQSLTDGEASAFAYEVLPSGDVQSTFASGDARQALFAQDANGNTYLEKYTGTIAQFTDRIPLLRVAELYLNRAEARYQTSDVQGARDDLDYIRVRRGLSQVSSGLSGQALLDSILVERRREFLFEGKRFFTYKRYERDIQKPNRDDIPYQGGPESYKVLAPLPTGEVSSNPDIVQNPGY